MRDTLCEYTGSVKVFKVNLTKVLNYFIPGVKKIALHFFLFFPKQTMRLFSFYKREQFLVVAQD